MCKALKRVFFESVQWKAEPARIVALAFSPVDCVGVSPPASVFAHRDGARSHGYGLRSGFRTDRTPDNSGKFSQLQVNSGKFNH
jgi:hypothetical protein